MGNFIVITILVIIIFFAIRSMRKKAKSGG